MKKACVLSIKGEGQIDALVKKLKAAGYAVDIIELDVSEFNSLRACDPQELPEDVRNAIQDADLVIFYLTETLCSDGGFEALAQCAAGAAADILGIWPPDSSTTVLPKTMADFGASALSEESPEFDDTICGKKESWELPDQTRAPETGTAHQKKC